MIITAIENNISTLENLVDELQANLELIGDSQNMSLRQALCLVALCLSEDRMLFLTSALGMAIRLWCFR